MQIEQIIKQKLESEFEPESLEIIDESHLHKGHSGFREGESTHFLIEIVSEKFLGVPLITCHKMIYETLKNEIGKIHALRIHAKAP